MYREVRINSKGTIKRHTIRGTSHLEGYHPGKNRLYRGVMAPSTANELDKEFNGRHNIRMSRRYAGMPDFGHFNLR